MRRLMLSLLMLLSLILPTVDIAQTYDFNRYGPTTEEDHLWSIANELKPSKWVTNQQVMIAIQQLNPEAFKRGNINGLRKGYLLRIPTLRMVQHIDPVDAELRVAYQNEHWNLPEIAKESNLQHSKVATRLHSVVRHKVTAPHKVTPPGPDHEYMSNKAELPVIKHVRAIPSIPHEDVSSKIEDQFNTLVNTVLPHIDQIDKEVAKIKTEWLKQIQQAKLRISVLEDENVVLKKQVLAVSSTLHSLSDKLSVEEKEFNTMVADFRARRSDVSTLFTEYGGFMMITAGLIVLLFLVYGLFYSRRRDTYYTRRPHQRARSRKNAVDNRRLFSSDMPTASQKVNKSIIQVDEDEDEYDFLNSEEGIAAKLDLARAYIDMGDFDTARQVLSEVRENGKPDLCQQADQILKKMPEESTEPA